MRGVTETFDDRLSKQARRYAVGWFQGHHPETDIWCSMLQRFVAELIADEESRTLLREELQRFEHGMPR